MDLKTRKKYYNMCDPYRTLPLSSGDVLDIDNYKIDGKLVNIRGKNWAEEIAEKISWSDRPQVIYFTGYQGSGKTTELNRVQKILENPETGNLLPVYINALDYLPILESLDEVDIFSVIIYNVIQRVSEYQEKGNAFEDGNYFDRFWEWATETEVTMKNIEVGADSSKVVLEMKDNPSFRNRIKQFISDNPTRFKQEVEDELYRLNNIVKKYEKDGIKKDGIVVIFDSLEHNRGIGSQAQDVAKSIQKLFSNRETLLLPVDVIYTIPPYLYTKQIRDIQFLPVVRVANRDNKKCTEGIEVMKELLYERIPKDDLLTIVGTQEALENIIKYSGGYPRDLLKIMQDCILTNKYPLSATDLESIFVELENEYRDNISTVNPEILRKVHETKELNVDDFKDEAYDLAEKLFRIHVILRYRNGEQWFSLNPPTLKVLGIEDVS